MHAALWPYRATLDRMLAFFDLAPASQPRTWDRERHRRVRRRQDGRERAADPVEKPTVSASPEVGPRPELGHVEAPPAADAAPVAAGLEIGQVVRYRQGRGAFEARIVEIDGDTVMLERTQDGARVRRPVGKLVAGP